MLVISFSKLIGVSLGLYISVASATPIAATQNTPAPLEPREMADPNGCGGARWLRRECVPDVSPQTWRDVCQVTIPNIPPFETTSYSACPLWTLCENISDGDDDKTIKCVNIEKPGQSSTVNTPMDPQIGSSIVQEAIVSLVTTQLDIEVVVQNDMEASVSAIVMSEDQSYAIAPQNVIVGKIHGKEITVCEGNQDDASQARECYPTGHYSLKTGDVIDFSWGMTTGQKGILASLIWPILSG